MIKNPKKLIEVALPLKAINEESAKEKNNPFLAHHPRSIHTWWARRPFTAARAILFAQMVNDPGGERGYKSGLTKEQAQVKRDELFKIIEDLVKWENTNNESVLKRAREKIMESWRETCRLNAGEPGFNPDVLPAFHDPFAGGGAIPLEAQRLGLESYASDLNPVAVMINKAMIEIPPKFAGRAPIGPIPDGEEFYEPIDGKWPGATGLAEDIRRYGFWMRKEAKKRIGHLYPQVEITAAMAADRQDLRHYVGQKLTVIAWLWARTVKSPNPMFSDVDVPLISSYVLSSRRGKEAYIEPVIDGRGYHFSVRIGVPPSNAANGTKAAGRSANFYCLMSNAVMSGDYIKAEGCAGRMGARLMAVVCDGVRGHVYISPDELHEALAKQAIPEWRPDGEVPRHLSGGTCVPYGLDQWHKLFSNRQLVALNTFSNLAQEVRTKVLEYAKKQKGSEIGPTLAEGGRGIAAYADAISCYLNLSVSRWTDFMNNLCGWNIKNENLRVLFARQAIPMAWDFCEVNPFGSLGNYLNCVDKVVDAFCNLPACGTGYVSQDDASVQTTSQDKVISTDPPYYDNINYADLSDFFYVWLRRGLHDIYPEIFGSMMTPKSEELVASPDRHGGRENAENFFMNGMTAAMHNLVRISTDLYPVTIYYAFKQSETGAEGTSNAGWESFLEAVITAGFVITGTWPIRTEKQGRAISNGTNALASSIVLVCRKRSANASEISKREFLRELKNEMPEALRAMQGLDGSATPVAPVDLAQAAIGPGMEIYSKYKAVLNADGTRMSVHDAIIEINRYLDHGDDFDSETQFCRDWFVEHSWGEGASGDADVLARAKGLAVDDVVDAGILVSKGGKTALMKWQDYPEDYDPTTDEHRPVWEVCHHLVRIHQRHGTGAAGEFLSQVQAQGEQARQLAYVLYTICERKGLAEDARVYNELATGWSDILSASIENAKPVVSQGQFDL